MSYEKAVSIVAEGIVREISEDGFDSFAEMARCYQMQKEDFLQEISSIFEDSEIDAFVSEDGDDDIWIGQDFYTYKDFMKDVRKEIKNMGF